MIEREENEVIEENIEDITGGCPINRSITAFLSDTATLLKLDKQKQLTAYFGQNVHHLAQHANAMEKVGVLINGTG